LRAAPPQRRSVPFLGLTVQPYEESCGFVIGFDFLIVEVIEIKKKTHFFQSLDLNQWLAWSIPKRLRF
jgi:hypothetical protein